MTIAQKGLMRSIINAFETGTVKNDYSSIFIFHDGPNRQRQITIGHGITEYGNLKRLIEIYIQDQGDYASEFQLYVNRIGKIPLVNDSAFKNLLVKAAKNDQKMRDAQDKIYDVMYWGRAKTWFDNAGFMEPLSMMVILDSFVHSGSILDFLRKRFPEPLPSAGGDEKEWIKQYVEIRRAWLANHSNKILRNTVYRMDFFKRLLANNNWGLNCPLTANGIKIC